MWSIFPTLFILEIKVSVPELHASVEPMFQFAPIRIWHHAGNRVNLAAIRDLLQVACSSAFLSNDKPSTREAHQARLDESIMGTDTNDQLSFRSFVRSIVTDPSGVSSFRVPLYHAS
jgi:hypothetical protein